MQAANWNFLDIDEEDYGILTPVQYIRLPGPGRIWDRTKIRPFPPVYTEPWKFWTFFLGCRLYTVPLRSKLKFKTTIRF